MRLPALLVMLLIVLTSCGDAHRPGREPDSTAPQGRQETFPEADERVPVGFREELCPDLSPGSSDLAVRLVVPHDYRLEVYKYRKECRFTAALARGFSISLDSRQTVRRYKEEWVDPSVGYEGDTGTGDIDYEADVAVYGERRGELLTWGSNNDGLPLDNRLMQADGVRLSWWTPKGKSARWTAQLDVVTASIAVVRTPQDTCTADGATATYAVPRDVEDVDNYGDLCHLYLRPRDSLLHYAQVDPVPRRSVEELAARLEEQRYVVSVSLEPGVATLDGKPADRLTWIEVRPRRRWDSPAGTWRMVTIASDDLHLTWGATPEDWRREGRDFDAFVASVRLSPAPPSRS